MHLIVGLGNPGARHAGNRHNIGFMAVDAIAERHRFGPFRARFEGLAAEGALGPERVVALKPQTYMNESGRAVAAAARFYKVPPARIIVIHDQIDLVSGKMRVKCGGGPGGHNGLRSLDDHLGPDYWRVRLGVGHPGDKDLVSGYVLHDFPKADRPWVGKLIEAVAEHISLLAGGDEAAFMNRVALAMNPPRPKAAKDAASPKQD